MVHYCGTSDLFSGVVALMKKKRIISLLLCVVIAAASFCVGMTVFAENGGVVFSDDYLINNHVYFYDEFDYLNTNHKKNILEELKKFADNTGLRVGVYVGSRSRADEEIASIAQDGASYLYENGEYRGSVFLYLDMSDSDKPYSYMYCCGTATYYYTNGDSGTENRISHTLSEVHREIRQNSSQDISQQLYKGLELYCRELTYYYQKGPAIEIPETSENSNTGSDTSDITISGKEYRDESVYFCDEPDMFSKSQKKKIIEMLKKTSDDIGFNLALYIGGVSRRDSEVERMAESGAKELFLFEKYNGAVYAYFDMDGYTNAYDYMFCAKDAFLYFPNGDSDSEDRVDKILQATETHFPYGGGQIIASDILNGIETYCNELRYYKSKGLAENAWYHDDEKGEYVYVSYGEIKRGPFKPYIYWLPMLGISIFVGLIVAAIISSSVKKRYKFKNPASASEYTAKNMMIMRDSQDIFLGAHTSKVRIQSSSGGGGGGGGGHHGGGGGGRHR